MVLPVGRGCRTFETDPHLSRLTIAASSMTKDIEAVLRRLPDIARRVMRIETALPSLFRFAWIVIL